MEKIRRCIFRPYRKGFGPYFVLTMTDTFRRDARGQTIIHYQLEQRASVADVIDDAFAEPHAFVVFEGDGFTGSPLHSDDSDDCAHALMGFLTLRPGDTDAEYFADYTALQLEFCQQHAESLSAEVDARFGRDE